MTAASRQLLHIAAHADTIEARILPALKAGRTVVLDRFWWSTFVYGSVDGIDRRILETIIQVEMAIWRSCRPYIAFLIDRAVPFRQECSKERFDALRNEYTVIAATAAKEHSVVKFENHKSPEITVRHMLAAT
ncbi:thymidylate kinase [compost metagenome]